ncbi:MAG: hypothetical protein GX234_06300 [Clostridiales bacterium]|nr:hypothetical protein [Clostridiales bacterium]
MKRNKVQLQSVTIIFIIGLFMHQYVMSNKFFNYFEMGNIMADMSYSQGDTLQLGRWFLPVATNLFTGYSIPSVNGVLLIGYLTITALLVCELLGIQSLGCRILTGVVILSFPGMAPAFSYGVNADAIGLGILLSAAGVYLHEKYRFGIVPGAVLIGLSIGIYQPSVAFAIAVVYGILFCRLLQEQFQSMEFVKKGLKGALLLILGFLFYYVMLQIILGVTETALSDYHGVDSMTSFTLKGIVKGAVYAYIYFLRYFFLGSYTDSILRLLGNYVAAFIFIGFWVGWIKKVIKYQNKGQTVWLLIVTALLPLGVNAAPFLMADRVGSGVDIYMLFSLMMLWALFLKLYELWQEENSKDRAGLGDAGSEQGLYKILEKRTAVKWCSIGAVIFVCFNGYILCNQAYHRMEAMTETTTSLLDRMVARIEMMPEWESGMPVCFVNPRPLVNENYQVDVPKYDKMQNLVGTEIVPWYNERAIARYMNVYLRFPVMLATEEQQEQLDKNPKIDEMPSYPAAESMQVIDGVLVVKVSNGVEQ